MASFDGTVGDVVGIHDPTHALFAPGPQVEVVLEELAEKGPSVGLEADLELLVGETAGLGAREELDKRAVALRRSREDQAQLGRLRRPTRASSPALPCFSRPRRACR